MIRLCLIFGLCLITRATIIADKTHVARRGPRAASSGHNDAPKRTPVAPSGPSVSPKDKKVRPFFVFGDSLVDNGNNNFLYTAARADMPPYGIDSPSHSPTGRFSNGLNIPDVMSEYIGSEPTMPYLDPKLDGEKLLIGANFASAGIGILNDTGFQFMNILRMPVQLEYFKEYQQRLSAHIGEKQAKQLVNQALVLVSLGGNDFVNNYYLSPFSARSQTTTLPDYIQYLLSEYRKILRKLYDLGARRVIVIGSGPMGCAPAEIAIHNFINGECAEDLQAAAALWEPQLTQMVKDLNAQYHDDIFIAANTQLMHHDMISDPQAFGFVSSKVACCGQGLFNGFGLCTPLSNLCLNRDEYVFWDAFHPTERAARLIVQQIINGTHDYMKPMNLNTIMSIDSYM